VSWRPGLSTGANGAPVAVFIAGFSLRATRLRRPESARLPVPCALFRCPGKGVAGTRREDAGRIGFLRTWGRVRRTLPFGVARARSSRGATARAAVWPWVPRSTGRDTRERWALAGAPGGGGDARCGRRRVRGWPWPLDERNHNGAPRAGLWGGRAGGSGGRRRGLRGTRCGDGTPCFAGRRRRHSE
jgi:hypothetical protein